MMKVSILTPSFNQARWLGDTLRSVRNQTYPEIEQIVMDGGSTDGSVEVLAAAPNITWRSEPDRGQSHALNKAFAASQGEIIGWLNSDDAYADRRAVAEAVRIFEENPSVGVVYGHSLLVNPANRVLHAIWAPPFSRSLFRVHTFWTQPAALIRRSVLTDPMLREDLHYMMDPDLWWRLVDSTEFRRLDLIVGVDRHQLDRKTMTQAYLSEREAFLRAHGVDPGAVWRKAAIRAFKVGLRLRGASMAWRLPDLLEPALDLELDGTSDRLQRQVLIRRRAMSLE